MMQRFEGPVKDPLLKLEKKEKAQSSAGFKPTTS